MTDEHVSFDEFKKLKLLVAEVKEVRPHPNADRLLLLKVDAGAGEKQLVAGLRGHYDPDELVGRMIVIVDNLDPANIRGEESRGMLLAATDTGSGAVRLLLVDGQVPAGSPVS